MHLPPEQAFWVFVQINEEYVKGYFSVGLMAVKEDAKATELLIQKVSPRGYRLLVRSPSILLLPQMSPRMFFLSRKP